MKHKSPGRRERRELTRRRIRIQRADRAHTLRVADGLYDAGKITMEQLTRVWKDLEPRRVIIDCGFPALRRFVKYGQL